MLVQWRGYQRVQFVRKGQNPITGIKPKAQIYPYFLSFFFLITRAFCIKPSLAYKQTFIIKQNMTI